jgi:hypothetical protein
VQEAAAGIVEREERAPGLLARVKGLFSRKEKPPEPERTEALPRERTHAPELAKRQEPTPAAYNEAIGLPERPKSLTELVRAQVEKGPSTAGEEPKDSWREQLLDKHKRLEEEAARARAEREGRVPEATTPERPQSLTEMVRAQVRAGLEASKDSWQEEIRRKHQKAEEKAAKKRAEREGRPAEAPAREPARASECTEKAPEAAQRFPEGFTAFRGALGREPTHQEERAFVAGISAYREGRQRGGLDAWASQKSGEAFARELGAAEREPNQVKALLAAQQAERAAFQREERERREKDRGRGGPER